MNHLITQADLTEQIICDSAGTSSYHIGSPPDRRMSAAATAQGIRMTGCARQFTQLDFEEFDLILAMDRDNYANICLLDRAGTYRDKVKLMCDFCTRHAQREVPDPYYSGPEGFNQVIALLMDACEGLLDYVQPELAVRR